MNRVIVETVRGLQGRLKLPGDKSISHRAVIFNGMAQGSAHIHGLLNSEDVEASRRCMAALGVKIERQGLDSWQITGRDGQLIAPRGVLDCGNSGTSMRLLSGVLTAQPFHSLLDGDDSLRSRPMGRVTVPLRKMGADISCQGEDGRAPLSINGGELHGIEWDSPIASAQVRSALLLAGLRAEGCTRICQPYGARDHTERMFERMGIELEVLNGDRSMVAIEGGQTLRAQDIVVPGDCSSAAFFVVAALLAPGSDLYLNQVGLNPTRTGAIEALQQMGAQIETHDVTQQCGEPMGTLRVRSSDLNGIQIPAEMVPRLIDELPILAIAGSMAHGIMEVSGAAELRVKESDRIESTVAMVRALGGKAEARPDGFIIEGSGGVPLLGGGEIHARGDHRIAMAGMVGAACSQRPCAINGADSAAVSFPDFWPTLQEMQAR